MTQVSAALNNFSQSFAKLPAEQKKNIALMVAGTILALGAVLLIILSATGKIGYFTTSEGIKVNEDFTFQPDSNFTLTAAGYFRKVISLPAINYGLYSVVGLGGLALLGWGIKRELERH